MTYRLFINVFLQLVLQFEFIKINRIHHYTPEGTGESHPGVHDLQSTTRLAESCMSQIMDTRSVVIDYVSPTKLFSLIKPI